MQKLSGAISQKLRKLFGNDVSTWPAHREPEAIEMSPEKHDGYKMGRRWDDKRAK